MKAVFTFIGLVILLAVGVFVGRTTGLPIPSIPSILPTSGPTATPKIITGAGVIKQIQHLNRLESTSYTIETVITAERAGGW